jgi:uncharacterized coiled-coil DUF342 family protein
MNRNRGYSVLNKKMEPVETYDIESIPTDGTVGVGTDGTASADTMSASTADTDIKVPKSRGIASAVATTACGCADKFLTLISAIIGVLTIISGGILAYQGTQAAVGFNYVLWIFAAVDLCAGIYIIYRTYSLASAMAQLRQINSEFAETQEQLESEVGKLTAESARLTKIGVEFAATNVSLIASVGSLSAENDRLHKINNELAATTVQLESTSAQLQGECNMMKAHIDSLGENINSLTAQNNVYAEHNSELGKKLSTLESQNTELGEQIAKLAQSNYEYAENNSAYVHENANLHAQVSRFIAAGHDFEKQVEQLKHERTELALANDKLRTAISALASANDSAMDVGKMIADVLRDMERERDGLKTEREAMEKFSIQLSSAIFAEMDLNSDGTIDPNEQSAWLKRIRARE